MTYIVNGLDAVFLAHPDTSPEVAGVRAEPGALVSDALAEHPDNAGLVAAGVLVAAPDCMSPALREMQTSADARPTLT